MPAGQEIVDHAVAGSATGTATPSVTTVADNASYSVAATFDTVAMADQAGRIAVTVTNTGTTTWDGRYALGSLVFASSNTTGTGTPLATGSNVALSAAVAPGGTATVESVTPPENPGSYTICWDMVNASGTYFSAGGGTEFCAAYTVKQFSPVINEQEPLPGTDVDSQTPSLTASAVVPGGFPSDPTFSYAFEILNGPNLSTATVLQSSGWVADNSNSWTPTTALTWGSTYYWVATVSDLVPPPSLTVPSLITWTTPISFVVGDAQPAVLGAFGDAYHASDGNPIMTSDLGGSDYSGSGKTVDPQTGNVSQKAADANVATTGPALSVVRTYNSLDPRTSQAFGAGWSSTVDMSLVPDGDGSGALILTIADGQQVRFAKNASGGYAAPQDTYAVVTALTGGGFSVTDQTDTTYTFAQASGTSWLISQITDNTGKAEKFTYVAGVLTTITSTTSGRALHLTWATPTAARSPHVATVSTDPAVVGQGTEPTWTYGYTGDLLTSVCPPGTTTAYTAYGYDTGGSHAPTAVRNADPTSYYRLDDATTATAAANEIPVDDLTTLDPPATEMNTTRGVAGPVAGVSATGFNGTSSWIPLDGTWCPTANLASACIDGLDDTGRVVTTASTAFSVWFRTTSASGVLLSADSVLPGGSCIGDIECNEVPLLWIGSNGHLEGLRTVTTNSTNSSIPSIYTSAALSSPSAVDNGAWHQAVLVPGQALYLDGTKVATSTSAANLPPSSYDALLGAGMNPGSVCSTCAMGTAPWQYFNGSLADLSIYQNQLPSAGTVAAQFAAETSPAAELTSITSPAGRAELSATYDTVNDRIAKLTDADGGTWDYGGAVGGTSSAAYDSAVLGSAPEDFWPLSDTAGPLAHDVVGAAATAATHRPPATFSNVTLGAAGPTNFPDGTAATFNGASSQITVPGGYFAGTGAETAELWFKTTKTGTLLSSAAGPTGGEPLALYIPKGADCLEGSVGSTVLNGSVFGVCVSSAVNDGKWHQAVLTLSPGTTTSTNTFSQIATLYQDGVDIYSTQITKKATASAIGYVADIGAGSTAGFLNGSVADVSLYTGELTADQVVAHFSALQDQVTLPEGAVNPITGQPAPGVTLPTLNTQTITVTDPVGKNEVYVYAEGSLARTTDAIGGVTYYGYDEANRASTITDPDGDTTYMTYDAHNNVTSTTTCAAINDCQTAYASYGENLSNPLDPRNDKPTDSRDARSSSPTDPTYDTVTTYTATGLVTTTTTPPTQACPAGCATTNGYTAGTEAAVGGGVQPAGLVASVTTPGGGVTRYAYDSSGDLMRITDPLGLVTTYTYDNLGRELTQTQSSDSYPAGLTTSYAYDDLDRMVTVTAPPVTDRVTGAVHTKVTSYTYDADADVLTTAVSDTTGGDPARTTTDAYNSHGELASTTDPLGNATSYTYDAIGDQLTDTNAAGVTTAYTYDAAGNLLTTTVDGYTGNPSDPSPAADLMEESRAYDPAGRLASVTDVRGTTTAYTYYGNDSLASSYVVDPGSGNGMKNVTTYGYDAAGGVVSEAGPGGLITDTTYNADDQATSQTQDPAGADRTTTAGYDAAGDVISASLTGGGVTQAVTSTYDVAGEQLSQTVDNTGGNLTTSYVRDQRGLVTAETDPEGNTTFIENDETGRPVVQTNPAVRTETDGAAPVTAVPVTMNGYDTFGDLVETSDPDGNVSTIAYDQDGRQTSTTDPSYTPPGSTTPVGGTTTTTYNPIGEQTSSTDPLGNASEMGYDQLGHLTSQTDPGGGTWTYTYDSAGDQTSVTDPTGAQTLATYDDLGQRVTSTDLVRQNASAAYTTDYTYDAAGDLTSQTSPTGVRTSSTYDPLGELTSTTDGAGNTTGYTYDLDGDLTRLTAPDGTSVVAAYDLAGRQTSQSDVDASGTVLRTESLGYDADGAVATATNFLGNTSTATYDAMGLLTSQTQPVSVGDNITESYGYDLDGHQTAVTDGNGNTTYATYNALGLPQTVVEPPAGDTTGAADSTTTDSYDANGDLVAQDLPGGVSTTDTYDANGDLTSQSGTGAGAPTATRTFTYDATGRMLGASTGAAGTVGSFGYQPATSESFSYDDRGLLLAASGSAGMSGFTYNASGQLSSATEAAGTSSFAYDSAGRLATDADPASGTTGAYSYNNLDQVTEISYGTGNNTQSFGYDALHRLTSDVVDTAAGSQVAAIGYGYDAADDVTSKTTSGLVTAGGGTGTVTNTYGYDEANRLTSWTATPAGGTATTATYDYDDDGNLTANNGVTYTYDARDQLTADSNGNNYSYAPDGDLIGQTAASGSTAATSDAYGQLITDSASSYTWDAMDRVVSAANRNDGTAIALTYDGTTNQVASDSSATYSRDPAGAIVGVDVVGGSQTLALNDQHDDLSGTFTAAGTSLTGSTTYDPWGQVLGTSGPDIQVGYQGQWTNPVTQQVNMGARFYGPAQGAFANQDTFTGSGNGTAVSGNPHAYADDNPVSVTDPTGHAPAGKSAAGTVTQGQVQAAGARAAQAQQAASRAAAQARAAAAAATHAESTATAARANAVALNHKSMQLFQEANEVTQKANQAYQTVKADQAAERADQASIKWLNLFMLDFALRPGGAIADEILKHYALDRMEADYRRLQAKTATDEAVAALLSQFAKALWKEVASSELLSYEANMRAGADGVLAGQAEHNAKYLAQVAAGAARVAKQDEATYQRLLKEYNSESKKSKNSCDLVCRAKNAGKKLVKTLVVAAVAGIITHLGTVAGAAGTIVGGIAAGTSAVIGAIGTVLTPKAVPNTGPPTDNPTAPDENQDEGLSRRTRVLIGGGVQAISNLVYDVLHGQTDWVKLVVDSTIGLITGTFGPVYDTVLAVLAGAGFGGFANSVFTQSFDSSDHTVNGWQAALDTLLGVGAAWVGSLTERLGDIASNIVSTIAGVAAGACNPGAAFIEHHGVCHEPAHAG